MSDYYYLGKITRTHGLKGHFLIYPDTDCINFYTTLKEVFILKDDFHVPYHLDEVSIYKNKFLKCLIKDFKVDEVEKQLLGREVYLPLKTLPQLNENQFYYHEIIGFTIVSETGTTMGIVQEVIEHPMNPLFKVSNSLTNFFIPMVNEWIIRVDRTNKTIHMQLPEGLDTL